MSPEGSKRARATSDIYGQRKSSVLEKMIPAQEPASQDTTTAIPQSDNAVKPTRKTDSRSKVTYYLDPGQVDKLDELRMEYKKKTGNRLNEQDFMRLVVEKLKLEMLL